MLFAVTLPDHVIDNKNIRDIQERFKKDFTKLSLWMTGFLSPFFILHLWTAYQVVYFLVWLCIFVIIMVVPFRRANRDTLALKLDNDWFVGTKHVIQSDLRVAYLKNQRSAPLWLFSIPFAMAIGLMLWGAREEIQLLGISSGGFVLTCIFLLISLQMRRGKAKVYSTNSEVNVSLNQANRRAVSYLWINMAIIENIHYLLICLLLVNEGVSMTGVWVAITILFTGFPIWMVLHVYRKINALEKEILAQDGKTIYTDDDEYWANGFTYHNPLDRSVLVPKRVGIGLTVNTGTLTGKIIIGGIVGLTAAVIAGTSFLLIRSELTSPTLTITPEHKIEIDYPMYSFDFNVTEIKQLKLVEQVPTGTRSNGEATEKNLRGNFHLKDLGNSKLYIVKNNPPYIQIKLEDVYIYYNEKDPLQTKQLYEQLQMQVENR
ncbi:hypothetical protein LOZ80_33050 [Paenibacillus sp. HWE-109]|uniref:DUF5808 domain-containing protein n=1 Tax=Paenibacillus sp. HWE-109 TaxID=1306526 RepID=UPI001EDD5E5D|nr:DUF5808 domain-containing protein [Paenibacillus sp. HWE-109]UKS26303.1 hypothetical protein LOZ80_33050 [Paenibacillus sp. HWE-109]